MTTDAAGALASVSDAAAGYPASPIEIVVFALDAALADRLREALPGTLVHAAETVSTLADLLVARPCRALGVEVAALGAGAGDLLARLAGLFPDLPVVVFGSPRDECVVSPLLSSGEVHAFLARPIAPGAAREAFESALRRNAALARSGDLRRAAVLRRSSTFLVRESRGEESAEPSQVPCAVAPDVFAAREPIWWRPARIAALAALLLLAALGASAWFASRHGPAEVGAGAVAEHVHGSNAATHGHSAAHARTAAAPAISNAVAAEAAGEGAALVDAAERAFEARLLDVADEHARAAVERLAAEPALAPRVAALLDEIAIARRQAERDALANARWEHAAREWRRMRAEEARAAAEPAPSPSRTSEASVGPGGRALEPDSGVN